MCVLSILVPTYNRKEYLQDNIKNISNQIKEEGLANEVELCISDNASTDGTIAYLTNINEKFIHINFNVMNYGYDMNLCTLLNMSKGKYIWFLSDDDVISKGAVKWIVEQLCNDLDGVYLKPIFFREKIDEQSKRPSILNYSDHIQALKDINWIVSFVSAFIMNRDKIIDFNLNEFIGLGFIHTPMVLNLINNGKWRAFEQGMLYARQNNSGGYNKYEYFGTNFNFILRFFEQKFDHNTIDYVLEKWMDTVIIPCIVTDKSKKIFNFNKILPLFCYKKMPFFWKHVVPRFFI